MWTNGDDLNDDGERVRLYQPIAYSSGRSDYFRKEDPPPTVSYIGGYPPGRNCSRCDEPMNHLVQLFIPNRKTTFQLWGCNVAKCVNELFSVGENNNQFSMGGGGVFYGESKIINDDDDKKEEGKEKSVPSTEQSVTLPPTTKKEETNDWMVDSDDDDDLDLEQQVAAMELKAAANNDASTASANKNNNHGGKQKKKNKANSTNNAANNNNLPCFELHSVLEPPGRNPKHHHEDDDDEDDEDYIGTGGTGGSTSASDAKIQQMLAKYMAEEEDEEILSALRGTNTSNSGGGKKKSREKDERLKASDRALLTFTDRIKRSPKQVLRYAPNGIPLWSIPRLSYTNNKKQKGGQNNSKKSKVKFQQQQQQNQTEDQDSSTTIPPCSCGSERQFEFQVMPSLLHVLEVDKHATTNNTNTTTTATTTDSLDAIMSADYGGMNWGTIAVYSCPNKKGKDQGSGCCDGGDEEDFLIVQASVDGTPTKRVVAASAADAPVFIKEDEKFDALTDDGDQLEGCGDDDDDETVGTIDEADLVFTMDG